MNDLILYLKNCQIEGSAMWVPFVSAIAYFERICNGEDPQGHYVGITNNPDRREDEHCAEFLGVVKCKSEDEAKILEKAMAKIFDTGRRPANGGTKDTKYVYIYKKGPETKE